MGTTSASAATQANNDGPSKQHITKSHEAQLNTMLLSVAFVLVILSLPNYIKFIFYVIVDFNQDPQSYAIYHLVNLVVSQMQTTNHAVIFFLYCLSGTKFRSELQSLFISSNGK